MTLTAPSTHTSRHDTTAHLTYAAAFLERANLEHTLANNRPTPSTKGTKTRHGTYTALALACTIYELIASHEPYTLKAVLDALWFRYTPDQMKLIGLENFRDPDRVAAMRPPQARTDAAVNAAANTYKAEYLNPPGESGDFLV